MDARARAGGAGFAPVKRAGLSPRGGEFVGKMRDVMRIMYMFLRYSPKIMLKSSAVP